MQKVKRRSELVQI